MFLTKYMLILMFFIITLSPTYMRYLYPTLILTGVLGIIHVDIPNKYKQLINHHKLRIPVSEKTIPFYRLVSLLIHASLICIPIIVLHKQHIRIPEKILPNFQAWVMVPLIVFIAYSIRIQPRDIHYMYLIN